MRKLTGINALLFVLLFALKFSFAYPGLWIEFYYPDNYRFALWEWKPIEHVTVTGPHNFFAKSDNTIIPLPSLPLLELHINSISNSRMDQMNYGTIP